MKEFTICDMKSFFFIISLWLLLIWTSSAHAQSTVIYQDYFEGAVSGWSDNSTDFAPAVTTFLGRFADGQTSTSRTFTMPANTDELGIEFDLYRLDSWDDTAQHGFDRFEVEIDGTEIFSLPFPNPQAARSGTTGNVSWSHTPLTGTEELGFNSGQYWFDQLHRFVITVNNPGGTVSLTLRADLTQTAPDESAGYDNFLVTAQGPNNNISAVAETFAAINGDSGGTTPSVLTSDTINSVILNPNDVTITTATSSSANVALNQSTGLITVAQNTAAGTYTVDYEICENINLSNCSSVTETVTVFEPGGNGAFCPAGTVTTPGTYHVISATGGTNPNGAIGVPLPEGGQGTDANSGRTFFPSIIYDLTGDPNILVPEGAIIEVSLASHFNSNAQIAISSSLNNTNFPAAGSNGSQLANLNNTNNIFIYFDYTIPAGGARYMELDHQFGGVRFDGVIFDTVCTPPPVVPVEAEDDNGSVADSSQGDSFVLNVVSNDTIDGITPTAFNLALAAGSTLPSGLTFNTSTGAVEVLQNTLTGTYSFDYELCQQGQPTNCDIATVTINVTNANPPSICPAGSTPTTGTFHVVQVTPVNGSPTNPNGALGAPLPEGSQDNNSSVTGVTFFQSLIYDLTGDPNIIVPEGTNIDVSLANHWGSNPTGNISVSLDGNSYTSIGSSVGPWTNNNFRYDAYIVPAGGLRFLQIGYGGGGGLRFDGVIYDTQCQTGSAPTTLSAAKNVAVYDPFNQGLYALPGNDVIYTITVENTGTGDVDSGSLVLIDAMPAEVTFFNGDIDDAGPELEPIAFQDTGGGLSFDPNADVGFSNAATHPGNFSSCTYTPIAGYDPDVTYICINPKGVMAGQSTMSVSFRSRIE